jgi:hypothetical protein
MGKLIVAAALCLVLGIFIGGVGPRAELARTRNELELARSNARGGGASTLPFALGLGGLVAAQKQAQQRQADPAPPRFQPPAEPAQPGGGPAAEARADDPGEGEGQSLRGPEVFAAARTAAALRAAQYREAFFARAQLSPENQAAVTATVTDMNRELGTAAEELTRELGKRSKLGPRDMADVGARVLDIYRRADDRFKAGLDEHARAAVEQTDFDLLTQIDLGAVEGLAEKIAGMQAAGAGAGADR